MKTTSRLALVAAAGLLIGAVSPATAADLKGGGCCADLEERIAELEATTARKGNRVVSLQIYGQVNKGLLIWDDGEDSDVFVVDNETSGSRIGLTGKATLKPGWSAGFLMEFDYQDSSSDQVINVRGGDDGDEDGGDDNEIKIRHNNLWIESERLGRITIGQGSTAADGAAGVNLANSLRGPASDQGSNFEIRLSGGGFSGIEVQDLVFDFDGPREDVIRYDSPSIYGFILSASWGDDDYADVALRFKKEFNSVRLAAAISYAWDERADFGDNNPEEVEILVGSASVMHVPTGLFLTLAAGNAEINDIDEEANYWYLQGGIEKKWLPYGATTLYAEYGDYEVEDFSDAQLWGFGVVQKFDSAAMEIYAQARFYDFDVEGAGDLQDISTLLIGSRIKF